MESSSYMGLMAVVAVSSSVALFTFRAHERLKTEFMKKFETELGKGSERDGTKKKKVRFAADVVDPSSNNEEYRRRRSTEQS